jgi:hypothetical protein
LRQVQIQLHTFLIRRKKKKKKPFAFFPQIIYALRLESSPKMAANPFPGMPGEAPGSGVLPELYSAAVLGDNMSLALSDKEPEV